MVYWRLEVSFPLNTATMRADTDKVEKIVGQPASDAGAGFGMRDVGWSFTGGGSKSMAQAAMHRLRAEGYEMVECRRMGE